MIPYIGGEHEHRVVDLEQQQTEKIKTDVRDVDRIRITNDESVRMLSRVAFWWIIRALQSDINKRYTPLSTEDLPGREASGVYF